MIQLTRVEAISTQHGIVYLHPGQEAFLIKIIIIITITIIVVDANTMFSLGLEVLMLL